MKRKLWFYTGITFSLGMVVLGWAWGGLLATDTGNFGFGSIVVLVLGSIFLTYFIVN